MDARAHFLLRAAAVAVLVVEALYPRGAATNPPQTAGVEAAAAAPSAIAPQSVVAAR